MELDVLVVGAGFGGVYALHRLRTEGYLVKVFEAEADLGGIWYSTRYPGAATDTEAPNYQYSLPELWKDWNWSKQYANAQEIRAYFDHVDAKLDVRKDIQFNTRVVSATFDARASRWVVNTEDGTIVRPRFLLLCTGIGAKPYTPDFPGLVTFRGTAYHTAHWPSEGVDLKAKRVGLIGTGASGVQLVQALAPEVEHLTVFQRTPNMALHVPQAVYSPNAEEHAKHDKYPALFEQRAQTACGFMYDFISKRTLEATAEERELLFEGAWAKGGFRFWVGSYFDVLSNSDANAEAYTFWRKKVLARVHDPKVQAILAPETPPHPFGTKRPSVECTYYEAFNQLNVSLVDIHDNAIAEITPAGLRTDDGTEHAFDTLIIATGYDAVTGGLTQIDISGLEGATLREKWNSKLSSFLGYATSGFPNMFWMYGPHGPTAFVNGPSCIEMQCELIVSLLAHMRENDLTYVNATKVAEDQWTQKVKDVSDSALWNQSKSWYMGANIPGKPVEQINWAGGMPAYRAAAEECQKNGYKGFDFA